MLYRCNILALVAIKHPNKLLLWDYHQNKVIGEILLESEIKAVRLNKDIIIIVLSTKICLFNFNDLSRVEGNAILN